MRLSTFFYCLKQGLKNICRNILFSLASVATISACIFLFCMFFSIVANVQNIVKKAESSVGITVFFDENVSEEDILKIGEQLKQIEQIKTINYISAETAWENFKNEYFSGMEELAEGFAQDNPLAGSASYEIYLNDIAEQDLVIEKLNKIEGIRKINYSSNAASSLSSFNNMVSFFSIVIIAILLAVSVFLISNTISIAATFRKRENSIMRLIGATNYMIRAPFVVEGIVIGLVGALIPLIAIFYLYEYVVVYLGSKFAGLMEIIEFLPIQTIFPYMIAAAIALGTGIGFVGSFFTIRKHLKV